MTPFWNEERKKQLLDLVDKGYVYSQIAQKMGTSRNSVAGILFRLGDTAGPRKVRRRSPLTPSDTPRKQKPKFFFGHQMSSPTKSEPPTSDIVPTEDLAPPSGSARVHLTDLLHHHCRWPGEMMWYCGKPRRDDNTSYCAFHYALAHRPRKTS